jgi:hypothetical protein
VCRSQEAVEGRRTCAEELPPHLFIESKMTMPLQGIDEQGEECPETLPADSVRRLPERDQGLTNRLIVEPAARNCLRLRVRHLTPKHPDGVLSVVSGQPDELIEDACLVALA